MKKVLLFLPKGFEIYEASVFMDVFGWNSLEGDKSTQLITCSYNKEVISSFNYKIIVDKTIDEVDVKDFDAIAIPGGFEEYGFYEEAFDDKFLDLIKEFNKLHKIIASICVAALPLGKSGILTCKRATTYITRRKQLEDFNVDVINNPIVVEDNVITSWNPSTAICVAMILLEKLTSKNNIDHIRKIMGFAK
ncbi:MAG: DJ-1 family protein [Marinilabiliales bacterium]|nr:MAG: DJ-1 family protein [Marinilabiliales bacterium]